CPGHVSSVIWDVRGDAPRSGCLEAGQYDRDPKTPGIQAQCSVDEGKIVGGKPVPGSKELEPCELEKEAATGEEKPKKTPCYVLQLNHNVCPAGPGVIIRYGDEEIRDNVYADATCNKAPAPAAMADPFVEKRAENRPGVRIVNPAHVKTDKEEVEELESQPPPPHTNMFFSIYFAMTGLHGLHVLFGIFVFIWLLWRAMKGHFSEDYFGPVDYSALYWHLVDLIWIFLFPLLYLIH